MQAVPELRPLGVGDIVDRVFAVYRSRLGPLLVVASLPYLVFALAAGVIGFAAGPKIVSFLTFSTRAQGGRISQQELAALLSTLADLSVVLLVLVIAAVAFTLVQAAALVRMVAAAYMGQTVTVGDAMRTGLNAFPRLLLMGIVAFVAFALMWAVGLLGAVVLFAVVFGGNAPGWLILVAVLLGLALIVATIFIQASWTVSPAVAILESTGPIQSLGRSWYLSGGNRWRILALQLLLTILQVVLSSLLSLLLVAALGSDPTVRFALQQAVNLLANIAWAPIYWGTFAILYYDLRVRKEALDLQLAVEALPRDTSS